ncbi:retrotransposon unclassified [Hordeum vulgare]|nr:retrotransposon unclassified [Hordeum vulgare]
MELQVFNCQGMVERGLNDNHTMITEFTSNQKMDAIDIGKHLSRLYDRVDQLQGQIYGLQNQNCREVSTSPPINVDMLAMPLEILQTHWCKSAGTMIEQVKVCWSTGDCIDATWEDKAALQAWFRMLRLGGQARSQEVGNVSAPDMLAPPSGTTRRNECP